MMIAEVMSAPRRPTLPGAELVDALGSTYVAIDFETADYGRDSACAVALVRVQDGTIVERACRLIRPPRRRFEFSWLHGITWQDVADQPTFRAVWRDLRPMLDGADFLVAHNAPFDRSVLRACCERSRLNPPPLRFECTVRWARRLWQLRPANLPAVCDHLGIELRHHDPASDAEACARIMMAVREQWLQRAAD